MPIYHYHAIREKRNGGTAHYEGIVKRDGPIVTELDYKDVRMSIAEYFKTDECKLTVCSLSRID